MSRNVYVRIIIGFLLAGIASVSCSCMRLDNVVYSEFKAFGDEGWDPLCVIPFSPWPSDSIIETGDRFDLILTLRYTPGGNVSDIPLEISEEDENGISDTRRITVHLRDKAGKPRGHKSVYLYELSDTLRRNMRLSDGYLVNISSLSPASNTRILRNIGLTLTLNRKPDIQQTKKQ